jgi:putative FmdB family regulatory protein
LMPIYEYVCHHCGHRFEKLVRNLAGDEQAHCPRCREAGAQRVVSSFAVGRQGSSAAGAGVPVRVGGG